LLFSASSEPPRHRNEGTGNAPPRICSSEDWCVHGDRGSRRGSTARPLPPGRFSSARFGCAPLSSSRSAAVSLAAPDPGRYGRSRLDRLEVAVVNRESRMVSTRAAGPIGVTCGAFGLRGKSRESPAWYGAGAGPGSHVLVKRDLPALATRGHEVGIDRCLASLARRTRSSSVRKELKSGRGSGLAPSIGMLMASEGLGKRMLRLPICRECRRAGRGARRATE